MIQSWLLEARASHGPGPSVTRSVGPIMVSYGPLWSSIFPYGPLWSLLVVYGPLGSFKAPYGPVWSRMVPRVG